MKQLNTLGSVIIASIACGVTILDPLPALSQENQHDQNAKNIVLVHGAWANASSWAKVIPLLTARGFHVTAVALPLTSLADDVATTRRALALENGPVLLVGHSYGGAVITEAGDQPNVVGLLYVAAYAPNDGESSLSLALANPTPVGSELQSDPASQYFTLSKKGIFEDFAQDLSPLEKVNLFVTQGPTGALALGTPTSSPAWKNKPTWFIVAGQDRIISPNLEAMEARRMKAKTIVLNTNHVAMLSDPERVAEFIANAAAR